MELILTSSPFEGWGGPVTQANGFRERLTGRRGAHGLFIASSPLDVEANQGFGQEVKDRLEEAGVEFASYEWLDVRTEDRAAELVAGSDFVILAGGHVPTQNAFFHQIHLADLLKGYDGTVMGISAGSMNSAKTVYAQPELDGEAIDPDYQRFLSGLGLTRWQILPHYQSEKDTVLDGLRVYEDVAYPDSMGRCFLVLPDGSYLYGRDGREEVCGQAWLLREGELLEFCRDGEARDLSEAGRQ